MRRAEGFGFTLAFGALAALVLPLAVALGAPVYGASATLRGVTVVLAAAYVAGLVRGSGRSGAATVLLACALAALLLWLPFGVVGTLAGATAVVAACRSGILYRSRPRRALALEAALGGAAFAMAAILAGASALSLALAVWGYFLVQSLYFSTGGAASRRRRPRRDAFEQARLQLLALLEDEPNGEQREGPLGSR